MWGKKSLVERKKRWADEEGRKGDGVGGEGRQERGGRFVRRHPARSSETKVNYAARLRKRAQKVRRRRERRAFSVTSGKKVGGGKGCQTFRGQGRSGSNISQNSKKTIKARETKEGPGNERIG